MIEITNVIEPNDEQMAAVIMGMRNPMNSWGRMDSFEKASPKIGLNDEKLMKTLIYAGPEHRKFLRMMSIIFTVTAPLYWWKEFDTYKIGTVRNSCSTMHKITSKEFDLDDFSNEHLTVPSLQILSGVINNLNYYRKLYLNSKDFTDKKDAWWQLIQLLPSSYNQKATIATNYEVIMSIYNQRRGHKLDEWQHFRNRVRLFQYSYLFIDIYEEGSDDC